MWGNKDMGKTQSPELDIIINITECLEFVLPKDLFKKCPKSFTYYTWCYQKVNVKNIMVPQKPLLVLFSEYFFELFVLSKSNQKLSSSLTILDLGISFYFECLSRKYFIFSFLNTAFRKTVGSSYISGILTEKE